MKKLRILLLYPEMTEYGKTYIMAAMASDPDNPKAIMTRPALLQFVDTETNEVHDLEIVDALEPEQTGDVRAVPAEVQVPVYPETTGGGEERGSESGGNSAQGSGELHEEGDSPITH